MAPAIRLQRSFPAFCRNVSLLEAGAKVNHQTLKSPEPFLFLSKSANFCLEKCIFLLFCGLFIFYLFLIKHHSLDIGAPLYVSMYIMFIHHYCLKLVKEYLVIYLPKLVHPLLLHPKPVAEDALKVKKRHLMVALYSMDFVKLSEPRIICPA